MMGSAANVREFISKLAAASLDGARREHEMILEFRAQAPAGVDGHRHYQPRILVRTIPPLGI